ncbi:mucin-binding protein [Streptococcus mitis]|uniref:mucin-binding protein n=1 Tax=Streptococcus mitis TaxID=28037 RepID=UPI001C4E32B7
MNHTEKQLKYSIRKVSVGAASVVIGALYLLMGAGIAHAEGVESARETERAANPTDREQSGNGETGNNPDLSNTDAAANTYNAPVAENPLVAPGSAKPRGKRALPDGDASNSSNGATGTESGENQPTGEKSPVLDANRKGETVKTDQPGVHVPKDGEEGSDDKNAHLTFDTPGENATVEYMYKIIQNMPDDFQNNERSYLRNMNTLGDALRFDENGNVTDDPNGKKLQPGEIREISSFGGWTAIMKKDGTTGKFAVGMKNKEGYFTGWYTDKDGKRQEGGMLGSDAMDRVYVHEQALDRRFNYMLMLAKGRTIANRTDKAQDNSEFDIKTANNKANKENLNNLPVKEKEDILQHSPNIEGFNGIEKTFTAFSTKYGSRLKIDFVTGYISDYEGSKGTYRIVVKAIKKDKSEETIYDHTINRIDGVVENEERYSQGVDLKAFNRVIKKIFQDEYNKKVTTLANAKYKEKYPSDRRPVKEKLDALKEEVKQELVKNGDVIYELPIDKDELHEVEKNGKPSNKFKEGIPFIAKSYTAVGNDLNNSLKPKLDEEVQKNSPVWVDSSETNSDGTIKSKDPDRVYKLLDFVLPTAKKIIYHADTDQLELQTDPEKVKSHREELAARLKTKEASLASSTNEEEKTKLKKEISALKSALGSTNAYTYLEARNGSQEAKILGSHMEATEQPSTIEETEYNRIKTNELAAKEKDGLSKFTAYFVEKEKVKRSNVLPDAELSKKITEEIGGDEDKLGKGGYFSTGDIPLDKDVVAYKIQVFAENEKRVGVNKQSPRLQYNLPILADFSVIQDTVEPSKEVAKRIIEKQVKEKKIPPEEGEKLKGKIDESKKTSEVRKAISGNVKVKYVDEQGRDIPLSDEEAKKVGEKSDNGTYLVEKEALIGSSYDVTSKQLRGINTGEKKYRLKRSLNNGLFEGSAAVTGSVTSADKVVTFVYEEGEATKAKAVVHVMKQQAGGTAVELPEHKLNLETEVGEDFPSTDVDAKVAALKKAGYEIVSNTFTDGTAESRKGDDQEDVDGQEPTQSYTITVQERTKEVTEPPTPDTPIDPNIPDGPKWPEEGLKESNLKVEVTRTITYVKKASPDGAEEPSGVENKVDKVLFKRTATYNLVTKAVTYGNWTTDNQNFPEVKTPLLKGYLADTKVVTEETATEPTKAGVVTDITRKVVYTKIGSWVPKVPDQEIPTPIPYPNDPDDPTKPKTPTYPETPETPGETPNPQPGEPGTPETPATPPVIPYVPGYTPKVPTDPTQPENPDTNPLKPLEPLDPNDPKKGYKVPEIPSDPKKNKEIEYVPNPQKILIKVVNITTGKEVEMPKEKLEFSGVSDQVVGDDDKTKVDNKIKALKQRGYNVESTNPITSTTKYDRVDDATTGEPSQTYKILVKEPISIDTDSKTVTRTITYVKKDLVDGVEVPSEAHETVTDRATFNREVKFNLVTGETTYGKWSEAQTLNKVASPVLSGYIADRAEVGEREVTATTEDIQEEVVYTKIGTWVPNLPAGETPIDPIPYPNHPTDPTKPGDPTPGVIPHVPGYTPKIGETPLEPKVPGDPTQGYTPPKPTDPKSNTTVTYEPDPQKALVKVVNTTTGVEVRLPAEDVNLEGKTAEKISTEKVLAKIADLEKRGFVVDNKDEVVAEITKSSFDKQKDEEGKDPSQVFTLKIHEKVVEVTEPPTPNTPIDPDTPDDPNDPSIPRWTEELVNQLSLKKDVTRTITYVKKDTPNGEEIPNAKPTVTQTAHFKRTVKVNVATGTVVEYTDWTSTDKNLAEVRTEKLDGYVADKLSVASVTVAETSNNLVEKVIYTKLGAWIPKIPKGVVPPEGTDTDPKPYPNHPTDPTKPGNPTDPNVPVIPYIPGYTPKIGETPLEPKVPGDPTKGYIPPAVPTEPNTNTEISYLADPQRAVVKVVNVKEGKEIPLPNDTVAIGNGSTDADIPKDDVNKKIADLEKRGYVVENKDLLDNQKFDNVKDPDDGDPTQVFTLKVHEKVVPVTPPTPDKPIEPGTPIDPTTPVDPDKPNDPTIPRWTEDLVKQLDTKKEVTRTITYVDEEGAKVTYTANGQETTDAVTDKVTFTRTASINVVTKTITYGEWMAVDNDTTFDAVLSPMVKGYVLKANQDTQGGLVEANGASVVASEHLRADSANQELKVVYTKLGSWIPKIPKGVVPPEGTDTDPKPYPNHPTDPTKPGDPTDPNTPNVPVIPYVPGYTPKIGETPLQPKVPGDPTKGYIPPSIPTEPGTDKEISYVPDSQRALVKVYNVKDGVKIPLENDTVGINDGKTDQAIPTKSLEDKIKELEKRGYTVDNKGLLKGKVFDNQKDPENGDPTQVYDLLVRERISFDTETKAVTRTIKYVKIEEQNGAEVEVENAQPTNTQTVNFSRDISINLATGRISNGKWSEKQILGEVKTPVLEGYLADKAKVESREVTGDSESFVEKVVYRKIGSWVPKVPGKEEPTPIPYPNDPDDPTKPKNPEYPETPGGNETPGTPTDPNKPVPPVIPYVPGYTPMVPTDPTKPVNPNTNPLKPLVPVDPEHPEKGYKVPPVPETPNDPKMDTPITYEGNPQKILIKVVNVTTGVEVPLDNEKLEFNGKSGETVKESDKHSVDDKITSLRNRGYIVDTVNPITATTTYDTESDEGKQEPTQTYKLVVREKISIDKESTTVIRTIKYVKIDVQDGNEVRTELNTEKIKTKVDKVEFSRNTTTSLTTGLTKIGTWDTETKELSKVNTPVLDGYLASVASVENKSVSPDTESYEVTVEYRKIGSWVPKVPGKEEPTPIPYPNDPDDPTKPKTPDYPTTPPQPGQPVPKVPVIPYVPGYTPKTPNGTPLVPIDPEHPEKGYKVPPVPETPNDPKMDTPIKYTPDGQRAIVKFVVVGEDGKETELVASRMSLTGKTGEKIPTENFNDTLKKLTGDPVNNGDYELVDNPLKDGATFDNVKDEEGKDPSQVFVVKLRQIYVIPPTPRIVERPSGNTVEVDVPNKDADTLSITFTKRNSTEKETIVTKKDKDGTWKIEKSPVGVTINPTNGRVYIPSEQVQPKTWVDTQTKHKYKQSKIVSVMPNILDLPKFEGTTEWIDVNGNVLRPTENGLHEKGRIANHVWLESRLEGNKVTHIFFAGSPSVDKPEYKITVWFDKDGNPLKPDQPGTHEAGNIPGYRYITTVTEDGITIHRFEKIPPVLPTEPIPDRPEEPNPQPNPEHPSAPTPSPELPNQETPIPEPTPEPDTPKPETPVSPDPEAPTYETGKREELPNTGTEANAGLAGAGLLTLLAGLGLGFFKKKEDESE